jgi:hypothetical protein
VIELLEIDGIGSNLAEAPNSSRIFVASWA